MIKKVFIALPVLTLILFLKHQAFSNEQAFASSHLTPQGTNIYTPAMVLDQKKNTAWVEGAAGQGTGEWIAVRVPDYEYNLKSIKLLNGYHKNYSIYKKNSRPKILRIYYIYSNDMDINAIVAKHRNDRKGKAISNEAGSVKYRFKNYLMKDQMKWQTIKMEGNSPQIVVFEIRSVYPGTHYKDTCISEVSFIFDDRKSDTPEEPVG